MRRKHGTDQGAGASDGGEVVTEKNVFVGRDVVQAIVVEHRRGGSAWVELHHLGGDEQAVVTVGDQVDGHCRDHDPQGIDRLASTQGDHTQRTSPYDRQRQPRDVA
ncbi:hypothetical protein D3C78_786470 [compost metagenome]